MNDVLSRNRIKKKRFRVQVDGKRYTKRFANEKDGRAWVVKMEGMITRINAGLEEELVPLKFEDFATVFLSRRKQSSTYQEILRKFQWLLDDPKKRFMGKNVHEIKRSTWAEIFGPEGELMRGIRPMKAPKKIKVYSRNFKRTRPVIEVPKRTIQPSTHNKFRTLIRTFYQEAITYDNPAPCAVNNPISAIKALPNERKDPKLFLSEADQMIYLDACYRANIPAWGPCAEFLLNTGMRVGNMLALRWKDFDENVKVIRIRESYNTVRKKFKPGHKTSSRKAVVGLHSHIVHCLKEWRSRTQFNSPEDFIFHYPDGKMFNHETVRWLNKQSIKLSGLPYYVNPHGTRHTYATFFLARGGNKDDLKGQLLHKTTRMIDAVYGHTIEEEASRRAQWGIRSSGTTYVVPTSQDKLP